MCDLVAAEKSSVPRGVTFLAPVQQAASALKVEVANVTDEVSTFGFLGFGWPVLLALIAWGYAWNGTALDKKTKSMLSIAILAASGRFEEVEIYTRGALRSGVTIDELKEILIHVTVYCGTPAGRQSFLAASKALRTTDGSQ